MLLYAATHCNTLHIELNEFDFIATPQCIREQLSCSATHCNVARVWTEQTDTKVYGKYHRIVIWGTSISIFAIVTGVYEGHSINSEIRCVSAIAYLLAESWCCLYKAPTFISHNTKETIS